ncbi:MAG: hypothetical protein C0501_21380 [Isosphaera sp.]|nr:hypothetical protein [Isosphaera sp.]
MSESRELLRRLGQGKPPGEAADEVAGPAFGYLRGTRERAEHVEFRLKDGTTKAFPYAWLGPAEFDPSLGIVLEFVGDRTYRVVLEGRNLDRRVGEDGPDLFTRGLLRHRVTWVRELDAGESRRLPEPATAVEKITVRKLVPGEDD